MKWVTREQKKKERQAGKRNTRNRKNKTDATILETNFEGYQSQAKGQMKVKLSAPSVASYMGRMILYGSVVIPAILGLMLSVLVCVQMTFRNCIIVKIVSKSAYMNKDILTCKLLVCVYYILFLIQCLPSQQNTAITVK